MLNLHFFSLFIPNVVKYTPPPPVRYLIKLYLINAMCLPSQDTFFYVSLFLNEYSIEK